MSQGIEASVKVGMAVLAMFAAGLLLAGQNGGNESSSKAGGEKASQSEPAEETEAKGAGDEEKQEAYPRSLFRGKVVSVSEAIKRRGVKVYEEELKGQVALETEEGELLPILPDWRGRAFYQDERLRNREVELIGKRLVGMPYLQVAVVFTFDEKQERQFTDYWCDICSIPMYEIKACECCQGEIRLRFQPETLPAGIPRDTGIHVEKMRHKTSSQEGVNGRTAEKKGGGQ